MNFIHFRRKSDAFSVIEADKNLEDIELEGFRVAENTAVKEEKKVITLTVAECMEFHSMGEFHENIKSVAEAVANSKQFHRSVCTESRRSESGRLIQRIRMNIRRWMY